MQDSDVAFEKSEKEINGGVTKKMKTDKEKGVKEK